MAEHPLHYRAVELEEGSGARVRRLFPVAGLHHADPFVLLDEFFVGPDGGLPDHPHRGFEAITYLFSGSMRHRDNLGNDSVLHGGDAIAITAGRGIVHSEMPAGDELAHGIQLWVNLAKIQKEIAPAFHRFDADQLPTQSLSFGEVRTLVGPGSPIHLHTAVLYHDVQLQREGEFHATIPSKYSGLIYAVEGEPEVLGQNLRAGEALLLPGGSILTVYAEQPCRFICCAGQPHDEPIVQHGSYVD